VGGNGTFSAPPSFERATREAREGMIGRQMLFSCAAVALASPLRAVSHESLKFFIVIA
jgi:hypothetical protein